MFFASSTIGLVFFWICLCDGFPLDHRQLTTRNNSTITNNNSTITNNNSTITNNNSTITNNNSTITNNNSTITNTTITNSTLNNSTSPASSVSTIRDDVSNMLKLIAPDALSRFVSMNLATAFGTDDPVQSNHDLSTLVDRAFVPGQAQSGRQGWVDTYRDCLLDVAESLPDLDNQTQVIDSYFETLDTLAGVQAKLVAAYNTANNQSTTNIGVKLASGQLVNALTMHTIDSWAASVFDGSNATAAHNVSGFNSKDYKQYLSLNASYTKELATFNNLETANKIATQGYMLQRLLPKAPAIFNLSMMTAGNPSSPSSSLDQYSAAWSAIILNSTSVSVSDALDISQNLNDSLHDGTYDDTPTATSINSEALESTSGIPLPTANSTSGSRSATRSATATSSAHVSQSPSSTSASPKATATGPARRSRLSRALRFQPRSRLFRRIMSASNALLLAASSADASASNADTSASNADTSASSADASDSTSTDTIDSSNSLAGLGASSPQTVAHASVPKPVVWSTPTQPNTKNESLSNTTSISDPFSSTSTSTAFSTSSTAVTGVSTNANPESNPLSSVSSIPLQNTASLFLMSLQEGAWSNSRTEFIQYIASKYPSTYAKYFGTGTGTGTSTTTRNANNSTSTSTSTRRSTSTNSSSDSNSTGDGIGMLGRRWTHIFLLSTFKANSTELETCEVVGMVWDRVPGLESQR